MALPEDPTMFDVQLEDTDLPTYEIDGELEAENEQVAFAYDEDQPNLVADFMAHPDGVEALKEIANEVRRRFDDDWDSSQEYRERAAEDWKLFMGDLPSKTFPFQDCANAHVPIAIENTSRIVMRVYSEVFGDWQNVFGVKALGTSPEEKAVAELLTLHGNWQIRNQIPDFKRQAERAMVCHYFFGDWTIHSYYDEELQQNRHEVLTPDEFVIPYVHITTDPSYADVPHMTKVLMLYAHQLEARKNSWYGVDKVLSGDPPSWDDDPEQPLTRAVKETSGVQSSETKKGAPYKLLWHEGWLELPGQGKQRYCQVILDYATKAVLKLSIHEEPNWQDKLRHDEQLGELEAYRQADAMFQEAQLAHEQNSMELETASAVGMLGPEQEMMAGQALAMEAPQAPVPPSWLEDPADPMAAPEPVRMEPVRLFTHGVCLESLRGALGLGYGRILGDYNRAANTVLSQYLDAMTLGNCWGLIVPGTFDGDIKWRPGSVTKVPGATAEDIAKIKDLRPGPANQQMLDMVKLFAEFGSSAMQAPDVLSGESGKSGETFRGISERIGQATKQLTMTGRKFCDAFTIVLKNNAKLNAKFLKDEEVIKVTDARPAPETIKVGRSLYQQNYDIEISADMRFTSQQQRVAEADEVVMMVTSPMIAPLLQVKPEITWTAIRKALEARQQYDLVAMMGALPPPPPMMAPPGMMPPGAPGEEPPPDGQVAPPAEEPPAEPPLPQ